jgi:hypothetical protein
MIALPAVMCRSAARDSQSTVDVGLERRIELFVCHVRKRRLAVLVRRVGDQYVEFAELVRDLLHGRRKTPDR